MRRGKVAVRVVVWCGVLCLVTGAAGFYFGQANGRRQAPDRPCTVCSDPVAASEVTHANCKPELPPIPTDIAGPPEGAADLAACGPTTVAGASHVDPGPDQRRR